MVDLVPYGNTLARNADQISVTKDLIDEEGVNLALRRKPTLVADGAGGFVNTGGGPVLQSSVRRFFSPVTNDAYELQDAAGERMIIDFVVIGMPGDDIRENDFFLFNNQTYTIKYVFEDKRYQVKGVGSVYSNGR